MKPRYHAVAVELLGGRTVFVVEHTTTGERTRIYRRGSRWLEYSSDKHVLDRAMVGAVNRLVHVLQGERAAQLSLYPTSNRAVKATAKAPAAATPAAPATASIPGAAAGAQS